MKVDALCTNADQQPIALYNISPEDKIEGSEQTSALLKKKVEDE